MDTNHGIEIDQIGLALANYSNQMATIMGEPLRFVDEKG